MTGEPSTFSASIIGREAEIGVVHDFVSGRTPGQRALLVSGEAGIGKTTVWEAGVDAARRAGARVLSVRASEAELELSYVSLGDLVGDVPGAELAGVPAPQLRALEIALMRVAPDGPAPEPLAVAAGFAAALGVLAGHDPVVVAIDDVPWVDSASLQTLAYAARRPGAAPVRFLLARRPGEPTRLEQSFAVGELTQLPVGPLSLGATRSMLLGRLDLTLPRRVLTRVCEVTEGNPLYALEIGRLIVEHGAPEIGADLPIPSLADDPFRDRIASLSDGARRALLATAVAGSLDQRDLASLVEPRVLDEALAAGLLTIEGQRVRAAHPLLVAAARKHSTASERSEVHLALAATISDQTLQTRHRAVATTFPDEELAAALDRAAEHAVARGAAHDSVELAEHALRLTPADAPDRATRMLDLARCLVIAGEGPRARPLLESAVELLPPGPARGRAHLQLGECAETVGEWDLFVDRALEDSHTDPALRTMALATKVLVLAATIFVRLDECEQLAEEALATARAGAPESEQWAACALAWIRLFRGLPLDDLREQFGTPAVGASLYENSLERVYGTQLVSRGELDKARVVFEQLRRLADERGEAKSGLIMHLGLCEVELRGGNATAAARLIDESDEWAVFEDVEEIRARCEAFLAAARGDAERAAQWAEETMVRSAQVGVLREWLEGKRLAGVAALLDHDHQRAAEALRTVWEHMEREGIDDRGVFPMAPDLIESLVELGEIDEARAITEQLAQRGEAQSHPSMLAGAARGRALLQADVDEAQAELDAAAARYESVGLHHDAARCLLILGRAQRRKRRWGDARTTLERAIEAFEALGAPGWADQARSELVRVGGRRRGTASALTLTEQRIAELAAGGRSNKEIAAQLVVSVYTVEKHLSHAYSKLGVHSRGQLAAMLATFK